MDNINKALEVDSYEEDDDDEIIATI